MIENPDFYLQYERMNPVERNQELRGIFSLLPDYVAVWPVANLQDGGNIFSNIDFSDFIEWANSYKTRGEQRQTSPLTQALNVRFNALLQFSENLVTESCRSYIGDNFGDFLKRGITKTRMFGFTSEFDQWGEVLRWSIPESGGIFSPIEAQEIDAVLYKRVFGKLIDGDRVNRKIALEFTLDPEIKKEIEDPEKRKQRSEEELRQLGLNEYLALHLVEKAEAQKMVDESIAERWRSDHISMFGDEP